MGNIAEALASEEVRSEVADLLYAMFAEVPKPELITAVLEHEPSLALEGLEWGFSDTVVREGLCLQLRTYFLASIGRPSESCIQLRARNVTQTSMSGSLRLLATSLLGENEAIAAA